jgi:hypothetical protein
MVYGLPGPCTNVSMQFRTPPHSSASTFHTPPLVKVKIEPSTDPVIHLSDSSDGDEPPVSTPIHKPSPSSLRSNFVSPSLVSPLPPSPSTPPVSIVQSLRALSTMPGSKNILKKLDYNTLRIEEVNFVPPRFDGNVMFVLPPIGVSAFLTKAKSMDGMDKRYDGHVWTKTQTTNITNAMGLSFGLPLVLATSCAKILSAITSNVLIGPLRSMILILMASPRSHSPLVVTSQCNPL